METGDLMARRGFQALALLWALAGVAVPVMRFRAEAGRAGEPVPLPTTVPRMTASPLAGQLGRAAMAIYAVAHGLPATMIWRRPPHRS